MRTWESACVQAFEDGLGQDTFEALFYWDYMMRKRTQRRPELVPEVPQESDEDRNMRLAREELDAFLRCEEKK